MDRCLLTSLFLALSMSAIAQPDTRTLTGARSLALSPDGTRLAFTWRGDVWVAPAAGGQASALTTNVEMDDNPVWSPDGRWIAFSSDRNGNPDIYMAPADGGDIRRMTWSSFGETPESWSPDGRQILYRGFYEKPQNGLYSLDVQTGQMREFWLDTRSLGFPRFSPDGRDILFVRRYQFPWTRPRFEGSTAAQLNLVSVATGTREEVRVNRFQHLWSDFAPDGRSIYTVTVTEKTPSTHNVFQPATRYTDNAARTPNVYRIGRDGKVLERVTNFVGGSGARFLTVARRSGALAFERDGQVFTMTPGGEPKPIRLTAVVDDKTSIEERLTLTNGAESVALNAKGDHVFFSVRRELWRVPVRKGRGPNADDAEQLTTWEGSDGQPVATSDEKHLFFVTDQFGASQLAKLNLETKEVTQLTKNQQEITRVALTPDGKHLSYWQAGVKTGGLFLIPIAGGEPKRVLDFPFGEDYAFSPDMRYLAYQRELLGSGFNPWENRRNIYVRDLTTGKDVNVTQLAAQHGSPAWSPDGKYLYFRSEREGGGLFALPLQAEGARPTELELKYERPKETPKLEFDFEDAHLRIRRIYAGAVNGNLLPDPTTGAILFNAGGDVWTVGYDGENARALTSGGGIGGFDLSLDGNQLVFVRGGLPNTLDLRRQGNPITGVTFRADWTRDVLAERRAAFREFWRIYNWTFYDPNFHGRDWAAIRDRNFPLLDSVSHRREMATVLNMMVGELEASHAEVSPAPGGVRSQSTAHLGLTFDYSHSGPGIKVLDVPRNMPGSFPRTRIGKGEFILAVNGRDVRLDQQFWRLMNEQVGREVTLTVNNTPTKNGARSVKYRALSDGAFDGTVRRNEAEDASNRVREATKDQVGYITITAMGQGNFAAFDAEVWQAIQGRKGLIIDVRGNAGGNIADRLLDILERRPQMLYLPRDGELVTAPGTVVNMPIVVLHDDRSVSNGEMFPAAMRSRGLAVTIGWETPGYVIYTSGTSLVDGTGIRLPGTGVFRVDGSPLENNGEKPMIAVDRSPEQFFRGQDPQLERAISEVLKKVR